MILGISLIVVVMDGGIVVVLSDGLMINNLVAVYGSVRLLWRLSISINRFVCGEIKSTARWIS